MEERDLRRILGNDYDMISFVIYPNNLELENFMRLARDRLFKEFNQFIAAYTMRVLRDCLSPTKDRIQFSFDIEDFGHKAVAELCLLVNKMKIKENISIF